LLELKIEKKYIYKNNCKYKNNTKSKMYIFTVLDKSRYMFIEITSKENINIFLYNLKELQNIIEKNNINLLFKSKI
jgi:hypothetical protein